MNHNEKIFLIGLLLFLTLFSIFSFFPVLADRGESRNGREREHGGFAGALGAASVFMLWIGAGYVAFRQGQLYLNKYLPEEEITQLVTRYWKKYRKPVLLIHNLAMVAATILAIIHGIALMNRGILAVITGWFAAVFMVIMTVSGYIIWYRFRPIWENKEQRKVTKFIHRQWIFSIILIVGLLLHLAFAHD